jgi:hypothetical protein
MGVYFWNGELPESGLPRLYIGQSGNVGKRLVQHNQDTDRGKDFWNLALLIPSSRQISGTAIPVSARFNVAMIWLSVNLLFFM